MPQLMKRTCLLLKRMSDPKSMESFTHIYAISDLHVDYSKNREFVESWTHDAYASSALILAGDVSDNMSYIESILKTLATKFKQVFYVTGNHEMWIRGESKETFKDSIDKFNAIMSMCERVGIKTRPAKVKMVSGEDVWIVPLFSWYSKPEDDEEDSLHVAPSSGQENVAFMEQVWMDNLHCKWDYLLPPGMTSSHYFASLNEPYLSVKYAHPVISFSHFVPNKELIFSTAEDNAQVKHEREMLGLGEPPPFQGAAKGFNFTRYAGSRILEKQIQRINPTLHVFGHQHRNRDRTVRGIRYVSHCLGNLREQKEGWVWGLQKWSGPKQVWPPVE